MVPGLKEERRRKDLKGDVEVRKISLCDSDDGDHAVQQILCSHRLIVVCSQRARVHNIDNN